MIQIKPFKPLVYNQPKIKNLSKVVCPPYDVISNAQQDMYYKTHPYNFIRLILGKGFVKDTPVNNKYTRSAKFFRDWITKKILLEEREGIYLCRQKYFFSGRPKSRLGFVALLRLQNEMIHPHEHTHSKPKEDRLALIREVRANLSPIFVLFNDNAKIIVKAYKRYSSARPQMNIKDSDSIINSFWRIDDGNFIAKLKQYISNKKIFIADGHHRFEVACAYRDTLKNTQNFSESSSYNYIMAYFTDMSSKDLTILPTHRMIKDAEGNLLSRLCARLSRDFLVSDADSKKDLLALMAGFREKNGAFGMYLGGRFYFLKLKDALKNKLPFDELDVKIFNKFILKGIFGLKVESDKISYSSGVDEAQKAVNNKLASVAFLLNPTKIQQLEKVVLENKKMPPKSTYFYPKALSGALIHKFED